MCASLFLLLLGTRRCIWLGSMVKKGVRHAKCALTLTHSHSHTSPPGSKYGPLTREEHPELEAVVSLLSAGPVAVGDRFGCVTWHRPE